jgi:3-hydroxyisobutyrate dehydrogenase-like beta-hydroxyacid dehydrogenase
MASFQQIGIISIGEMGFHWAKLLKNEGVKVLTCLEERSEVTKTRAENAGVQALPSLKELVTQSDLIVSIVTPSAAINAADRVAGILPDVQKDDFFFLDANAISPMSAHAIKEKFRQRPEVFVDGCIIGSSKKLADNAIIYVSGPRAERLSELEAFGFSVKILGQDIGQASAFKIIYAGLTKGLQGLLVELLLGAKNLNILEQLLDCYDERFPGLIKKVGRSISALPIHAGRRSEEMEELNQTLNHYGLQAHMPLAVKEVLKGIAALNLGRPSETGERSWNLMQTLDALQEGGFLQK